MNELPALPGQGLNVRDGRARILELRASPDALEEAIWAVDAFAEACDQYRNARQLPFLAPPPRPASVGAAELPAETNGAGIWGHFSHGSLFGLDATLLEALDRVDALGDLAGEPGSERWEALLIRAGAFGGAVTDRARSFQLTYRLQIGVIRMFARSDSLREWIAASAGSLRPVASAVRSAWARGVRC